MNRVLSFLAKRLWGRPSYADWTFNSGGHLNLRAYTNPCVGKRLYINAKHPLASDANVGDDPERPLLSFEAAHQRVESQENGDSIEIVFVDKFGGISFKGDK